MLINEKTKTICTLIKKAGGTPYFVGGCVRDSLIGINPKDIDIEVFDINLEAVKKALSENQFNIGEVGKSFSVIKVDNEIDISSPRRETKIGEGHKGFEIISDHKMSIEEAASRRDFTFNAIMMNLEGSLIDHFGGQIDLHNGVLRACSEKFKEDPLRVLRAMQFIGREYAIRIDHITLKYCQELVDEFNSLSKERVYGEFVKMFTKGKNWGGAIKFLRASNWLQCFPDLWHMDVGILGESGVRKGHLQEHSAHPEGNVFEHTCYCLDEAGRIADRENLNLIDREILGWATLLHDVGKPHTYEINEDGRICNYGHDKVGAPIAKQFLIDLKSPNIMLEQVPPLVVEHMFHIPFFKNPQDLTIRVAKRLMLRLYPASPKLLVLLCEADHCGRPPLEHKSPALPILPFLKEIGDEVKPILKGRHLIDIGMKPGPKFGEIIKNSLDIQIKEDWKTLEDAMSWVMELYNEKEANCF